MPLVTGSPLPFLAIHMMIISRFTVSALAVLALSGCSSFWPEPYFYPKGYTEHDITPISTPHGYKRTAAEEHMAQVEIDTNADAWRNAIGTAILPLQPALEMNRPVAITSGVGTTPLQLSATNYTREMMVKMGYLIALPAEANQYVDVRAVRSPTHPDMIDLTLQVMLGNKVVASNTVTSAIPHQVVETMRLPGFTTYPSVGPKPVDTTPYHNLNQD